MTNIEQIVQRIIFAQVDIDEVVKAYKSKVKEQAEYQLELDRINKKQADKKTETK